MHEAIAHEDPALRALLQRHTLDLRQVGSAGVAEVRVALPAQLARARGVGGGALGRAGVGVEEGRRATEAAHVLLHLAQALEEGGHAHRVVARRGGEHLAAAAIGLALHVATVGGELGHAGPRRRERVRVAREGLLDRRVPTRRVGDLVPDHVGELVLVVGEREQPARDEDVAARQREGVGLVLVDHLELVLEAAPRHAAQQLAADPVHVGVELRVLDHPDRPGHLVGAFATDPLVVVLRVQDGPLGPSRALAPRARAAGDRQDGDAEPGDVAYQADRGHGVQGSSATQEPSENHLALSWVSRPVPSRVRR